MNGLAEIDINGEKIGLRYGPAISFPNIFPCFESNKAFDEKIFNEVISVEIIYWGYQHHCVANRQIPKYKYEDILNWVLDAKNIQQASEAILAFNNEVRAYTNAKLKPEENEEKKRSIGKKSKKQPTGS